MYAEIYGFQKMAHHLLNEIRVHEFKKGFLNLILCLAAFIA